MVTLFPRSWRPECNFRAPGTFATQAMVCSNGTTRNVRVESEVAAGGQRAKTEWHLKAQAGMTQKVKLLLLMLVFLTGVLVQDSAALLPILPI